MGQVAPSRVRGALGSINQLVICIGIVAALVANVTIPATSWRSLFLLATAPAAALGLGVRRAQRISAGYALVTVKADVHDSA